jgi:hypothetical protein
VGGAELAPGGRLVLALSGGFGLCLTAGLLDSPCPFATSSFRHPFPFPHDRCTPSDSADAERNSLSLNIPFETEHRNDYWRLRLSQEILTPANRPKS